MNKQAYFKLMKLQKKAFDPSSLRMSQSISHPKDLPASAYKSSAEAFLKQFNPDEIHSNLQDIGVHTGGPTKELKESFDKSFKQDLNTYEKYDKKSWWEQLLAWFKHMHANLFKGNPQATQRGTALAARDRARQYFTGLSDYNKKLTL